MQGAARILANTPVWVFALLAYLIWQGYFSGWTAALLRRYRNFGTAADSN